MSNMTPSQPSPVPPSGYLMAGANPSLYITTAQTAVPNAVWQTGINVQYDPIGDSGPDIISSKQLSSSDPRPISASLYFKYVKKGVTPLRREKLRERLKKLEGIRLEAVASDQRGLLEAVEKSLLTAAREQILLSHGFTMVLERARVDRFLGKTKNVYLKPFEQFPRPIPKDVAAKLKQARELQVFDAFQVLYTDYTSEPVKKDTPTKVRERDPILFGQMATEPAKLYAIADWVDEKCDLTLDALVEREHKLEPAEETEIVQRIDDLIKPEGLKALTARVQDRLKLLDATNVSTWREAAKRALAEEQAKAAPKELTRTAELEAFRRFAGGLRIGFLCRKVFDIADDNGCVMIMFRAIPASFPKEPPYRFLKEPAYRFPKLIATYKSLFPNQRLFP